LSGQARDALPLLLWHLGRKGGGPRYTLELAKSLIHRDDVRLSLALSRQSDLYEETAALGLPTLGIDTYQSAAGFAASVPRLPLVRARLGSFVRAQGARIALCSMVHLWNPLLVGALKRNGAKNVLVVHDAAPHPGDEHLVRGLMLKNDFRQADLLVSLTDQVGQRLVAQQGIRSEKIIASTLGPFRYRGASPVAPKTLGTAPFRLLFFGRLLPYKGLDLLIGAMALLAAEAFPVTLRLVGQGPQELGPLPANIELRRGWVAEAAIPGLFEDIDLVVLPYREASQSGVLPIAQDLAIPALVTPVGGLTQQVGAGETGFIADSVSAAGLAAAIRAILNDPRAYAAMSLRLAGQSGETTWRMIADKLVSDLKADLKKASI
jgi:glycosyltransferase involved in cell wall biosynthesis